MLQLKNTLEELGLGLRQAAGKLGISPASLSLICNYNQWPRKNSDKLKQQIIALVLDHGLSPAKSKSVFKATNIAKHYKNSKDLEAKMLLQKQTMFPKTRKQFGLMADPFADLTCQADVYLNPDSRYIRETMYHTAKHGGMLAVVGESGSGKSTLRKDLIARIKDAADNIIVIEPYVLGMEADDKVGKTLRATHISEAILQSVAPTAKMQSSPEGRFRQIHNALKDSNSTGHKHVLIIEEAHCLPLPTLKHLKRFYELEDGFTRLLAIILIGQPELHDKLSKSGSEVREVTQRCEVVELPPMTDIESYVRHRLSSQSVDFESLFDAGAMNEVGLKLTAHDKSLAHPLAIGNLLTAALNMAVELGETKVTADVIRAI